MKQMRYFILTLIAAFGLMLAGCIEDGFTTSPSDTLVFSRDTVSFDTVFTDLGTPTARLVVHNNAKKGINISSIRFADPQTRFRLNVDGVSGSEFHDVEIRPRDSIYVFIECYIPAEGGDEPRLVSDKLEFVTNGVTQDVVVEAWGQNVTRLRNVRVDGEMRLTADRPYVIFDSLTVERGALLRVDPGARLLFHDGASLVVEGRIEAVGTTDRKIQMRGDRLDNVLPDVSYDIMAGQWKGMRIAAESFDNRLEFVDMRSTVQGLVIDSTANVSRRKLTLVNSWLHNSQGNVLTSSYAKVDAYGCIFSEAANSVVSLTGGSHDFLQCTIANNYLFSAIRGPLLHLGHVLPAHAEENDLPLMQARFANGIIYGLGSDLNEEDLTGSEVYFLYVSLKSKGEDDDNFRNCLWDTDPLFLTDRAEYYFNYGLQADSPVAAAGDPALVTPLVLTDMAGHDRLARGNPSLGALQAEPE